MIDLTKYNFNDDELHFLDLIKANIKNQNEIDLQYNDYSFCIEPSGDELTVVDTTGEIGVYNGFDDLFANFMIDGKPLIDLVPYLDFA